MFWTWKVRRGQPGRPPVSKEIRELIRTMSRENPIWGAPRIHGELLKLGIDIGETSVSKYMVQRRNPPSQTWRTFLENHLKTTVSTLREIEVAENFIFAVQPANIAAIRQRAGLTAAQHLCIVVFAYEYRPAGDTCSKLQADLVFSRTGISRVGTRDAKYNPETRGFDSETADDPFAFQVCPARYGAFLSVRQKGSKQGFVPMRFQAQDAASDFWIPVHKLFDGAECIQGLNLQVAFDGFHYNDKIRRVQVFLKKNPPATAPFQLTDGIADFLTGSDLCKGLVCATPHPRLVEEVRLNGAFVTFPVPANNASAFAALEPGAQRDQTTGAEVRPAPAYVHARTKVKNGVLSDLGNDPTHPDVLKNVQAGNYDALHYTDFTGDGRIDVGVEPRKSISFPPQYARSREPRLPIPLARERSTSRGNFHSPGVPPHFDPWRRRVFLLPVVDFQPARLR